MLAGCLLLCAPPAAAEEVLDPDTEVARQHFDTGLELYGAGRYHEALREFERTRALRPSAALDYNIGRCQERLEEWDRAVDAYERFVAAAPRAPEVTELRARLEVLRARAIAARPSAVTLGTPERRWRLAAALLGGGVIVVGAAASGAYFSAYGDYRDQRHACQGRCVDSQLASLRHEVGLAEGAGYALFAVGGAMLVLDVAALIAWRRAATR